jgi:serine/threonine protein phosphatase PrpC
MHRAYGIPRQDDFAVHHLPNGTLIVTVADGVSQAPQSHIGAQTATRYAANWLQLNLTETVDDTDWTNLLQSTAWALNKHAQKLFGLADPDPFRTEQELATTLVCGVVEPLDTGGLRAHLINCGDSSTWTLSGGCFTEILGGKAPDSSGIASSEVAGLPRVPRQIRPTVIDIAPGDVLLIGTDGIGEPLGNGEGAVGTLLRDLLLRPTAPSLIEFAHPIDFSRETFDDDRTLVAVWPNTPPP